jgi:hypothetical protein
MSVSFVEYYFITGTGWLAGAEIRLQARMRVGQARRPSMSI